MNRKLEEIARLVANTEATRDRMGIDSSKPLPQNIYVAMANALPVPATEAEADEQIAALNGGWQSYGRNHREWAQAILDGFKS